MEQWYLLYTKPHKELLVQQQLEERGLEVFFPAIQVDRGYSRGARIEPFFPNYLFVYADLLSDAAQGLQWTPGLRSLVHFDGNRPARISEDIIALLRVRLEPLMDQVYARSDWLFEEGQPVKITKGPFTGLEAIFQKGLSGTDRVQVLLHLLGSWTRTELPVATLEAI